MRAKSVRAAWAALCLLVVVGCGGGTSREELMRRAMQRPRPDAEDDASASTADEEKEGEQQDATASAEAGGSDRGGVPTEAAANADGQAATDATASPAGPDQETDGRSATSTAGTGQPTEKRLSTTLAPPETPWSEAERQEFVRKNLEKIGIALAAYTSKEERIPRAAITARRIPLLSWRVELLPYLGLKELYDRFHLEEPWNSPHNLKLLPLIPAVYQSPDRFDERTIILGNGELFEQHGYYLKRIEDSPGNTIAIVEASPERAVPWTQPGDWQLDWQAPGNGLGGISEGGFYAVSALGQVVWVPIPPAPLELIAAFTPDSGDPGGLLALMTPLPPPPADMVAGLADGSATASPRPLAEADPPPAATSPDGTRGTSPGGALPPGIPLAATPRLRGAASGTNARQRRPLPGVLKQREARRLFRDVYGEQYAEAEDTSEKSKLIDQLLETLPEVREDAASHYVLLEIIRDIGVQADELEAALQATDELVGTYAVDQHELRRRTISSFVQKKKGSDRTRHDRKLMEHALRYSEEALRDGVLSDAEELCNLAIAAIQDNDKRKEEDEKTRELIDRIAERRDIIQQTRDAQREAEDALVELESSPDDIPAQLALGRYLCFFKGDWANGLPILAEGSSGPLQELTRRDLAMPQQAEAQAELGDAWWDRAERANTGEALAMQRRAVVWYQRALASLPGGLQKVRIQKRLEDFEEQEQERVELVSEKGSARGGVPAR